MTDGARTIETAERVLDLVRSAEPAAEAEVGVRSGVDALTRFANSFIHQNVAEDVGHVFLRVALGGRTAATALDGPATMETLRPLVDRVLEAARVRPIDPDWPGIAPAAPAASIEHWDEATTVAAPDERAVRVADFVAAAEGLETAGSCTSGGLFAAFANTAGQRLEGRASLASIDGIARTGTSDGSGRAASVRLADVEGGTTGRIAARKARDAAAASDLSPGRYEVVLEPGCVANLLQFLFVYGFNGRAVEEGRSFVRLGERQFDPAITLLDDATHPETVGLVFDAEGTPKRRVEVVREGVTSAVLHTRRTAGKASTESTGHAIEGADALGALPQNPILEAGTASTEELVARMDRGLLVTDFWYTRILDPRTTVVTGLTRNGVWLVEGGRIVRAVTNLRFTQSFADALAPGAVRGVGRQRALTPGGMGGTYLVPPLHLAEWSFTGGARG